MRNDKIGFGIIGLGLIYKLAHALAYRDSNDKIDVVAVCDIDQRLVDKEAERLGAKGYTDYQELLKNPNVEAVDIILPHHLHYPVAKMALELGKHVVVEKPMTVKPQRALDLIELAKKQDVKFIVDENTRYVSAYIEAKKLLDDDVIGEPRLIRTLISGSEVNRLKNTDLWKGKQDGSGGGVIVDAGAHSFFLIKWLFGEIESLQTLQAKLVEESQVEDWAIVAGHLKSGAIFSTEYTFTSEGPWNERLEIHGSKGAIIVDQLRDPPAIHYKSNRDYEGSALEGVPFDPYMWKQKSIATGILDFIDAIWEDKSPMIDPMDGYYAVKIIECAYKSAKSGKEIRI